MNTKALIYAGSIASLCAAAIMTVSTWPPVHYKTWEPTAPLAWWQFEWLANLGMLLAVLPNLVIFKLDRWFSAAGQLRDVVAIFLVVAEILVLCFGIYKAGVFFDRLLQRPGKLSQPIAREDAHSG